MANRPRGNLYIGVTNSIARRVLHKEGTGGHFTRKYNVRRLVYAEEYHSIEEAINREKQLKNWQRAWKIELIEKSNPTWDDLYEFL